MKIRKQRSLVTSREQAGQLLSGLGQALSAGETVVVPLDEEVSVTVPERLTVSYELRLDESGQGKLEFELHWAADIWQHATDDDPPDPARAVEPRHRGWLQPAAPATSATVTQPS